MANGVGGIVNHREYTGKSGHYTTQQQAGNYGRKDQLPVSFPNFCLRSTATQHLTNNNSNCITHGEEDDAGKIVNGAGDILCCHHI